MENKPRPCGCKGIRTCLICENDYGVSNTYHISQDNSYVYCPSCDKAYPGWDMNSFRSHPDHEGEPIDYPGISIKMDFLSENEEAILMQGIDEMPWDLSQSGRRKQNFGPKCNFRKQKLKPGSFAGFPAFTKFVQDRFSEIDLLSGYQTVEQCSLEYDPARGASIDPHVDDCWVWGERIITVNLLADSVLTMTSFFGTQTKYNLPSVPSYLTLPPESSVNKSVVVRIPMPRRSLLVIHGAARYQWLHCILREDIMTRRVCLAYRELTPPFLETGSHSQDAMEILDRAKLFWNHKLTAC